MTAGGPTAPEAGIAGRSLADTRPSRLQEWLPGIAAARLRPGTRLENGRTVGETDRVVHLIPIPITRTMPEHLDAFCGQRFVPGDAEQVRIGTGMPCIPCIAAAPSPAPAA